MKIKKIIVLFFVYNFCFAQNEANIWYFGLNGGLDFNQNPPTPDYYGQINTFEGCATMCDSSGQLMLYSDGVTVWNRNHQIMINGTGLKGGLSSTQAVIIVPKPGSNFIYYIFTTASEAGIDGIRFSEVDMSLGNGLGGVTSNKNILLYTPVCEKLTVVKNTSCDGYWVLTHAFNSDAFLAFEVTNSGVNTIPIVSSVGFLINGNSYASIGQLKFSPNGTKIAFANSNSGLQLLDFNSATGSVSNPITITTNGCYGAEFSPSNNILYTTKNISSEFGMIYQYDLSAQDIANSQLVLASYQNSFFGALQLAPDGKIYCANSPLINGSGSYFNSSISSIENPDVIGVNCIFNYYSTTVGGLALVGLPQSIQSIFNNYNIETEKLCFGGPITFKVPGCPEVLSAYWDFGDGNTSNNIVAQNTYLLPGSYLVTVEFTTVQGTYTRTKDVTVVQNPIANPIPNTYLCGEPNYAYNLNVFDNYVIGNQSTNNYTVSYFSNIDDAINNYNPITNQSLFVGANILYARIHVKNNVNCYDFTSLTIYVSQEPLVNDNVEFKKCDEFPFDMVEQFTLSTKNDEIILNNNISEFTVSYHYSLFDAQNNLSALNNNYTNTLPEETLFARVQSSSDPNCFEIARLILKVLVKPIFTPISNFIICDDDESNDGIANFDLTLKNFEILNGQSPFTFNIKYYLSYHDAQNNINPINNNYTNITNPQEIFIRISNIFFEECFTVGSFQTIVNSIPSLYINETYPLCENGEPITINVSSGFSSYLWSNGNNTNSITINEPGNYSITASIEHDNLLCSITKNFNVFISNQATIIKIITDDWNDNQNSFIINVIGLGNYEYSLDGLLYQDSNHFENLNPGEYVITVRDKNGCGIVLEQIYLLSYPKFFTPNGDYYNDFWKIKHANHEPNLTVKIFDRYGNFLTSFNSSSIGWDGTVNNRQVPADDYWFVVVRENKNIHKGHFALKR